MVLLRNYVQSICILVVTLYNYSNGTAHCTVTVLQTSQLRILVWSEILVTLSIKNYKRDNSNYKPIYN